MDYYDILGIKRNASESEVKKAYKKQAMQHHPDRGGDANKFQQINEAYETLKDPAKKSNYDKFGSADPFSQQGGQRYQEYNFGGDQFGDVNDIFNSFFGGGGPFRQRRQVKRNRNINIRASISLEDVLNGKTLIATYRLSNGKEQSVNIDLPKGVENNSTIRFQGLGDDFHKEAPRGDLFCKVVIEAHPVWQRNGCDLHKTINVNAIDLILGTKVPIKTLDGKNLNLNIPKGCRSGTVMSIHEHGLPRVYNRGRGNIYITVNADIPQINDPEILKLLRNIKDATD